MVWSTCVPNHHFSNSKYVQYSCSAQIEFMPICFFYEQQKGGLGAFFQSISLNFIKLEINESSRFKAGNDFDFLSP